MLAALISVGGPRQDRHEVVVLPADGRGGGLQNVGGGDGVLIEPALIRFSIKSREGEALSDEQIDGAGNGWNYRATVRSVAHLGIGFTAVNLFPQQVIDLHGSIIGLYLRPRIECLG